MILALDLGSTYLKAAIFDKRLTCISDFSVETPYLNKSGFTSEIDVDDFWLSCVELIASLCEKSNIKSKDLTKISITSQAQTFTILNKQGKALIPFITWEDKRAKKESEILEKELGSDFHQHCSFSFPMLNIQISLLLWLLNNYPHLFNVSHKVVSLPGYLVYRLVGKNLVDRNLAAMSGLYSLKDNNWWQKSLDVCGLTPENLPSLVNTAFPIRSKTICKDIELSKDVEIVLAGNDQTAGAFGNNAHKGYIIATLGTALVVYRYAGTAPGPYNSSGCWGPYPSGGYYELAVRNEGTSALNWARKRLMPGKNIASFFKAAEKAIIQLNAQSPLFYPEKKGTESAWKGNGNIHEKSLSVLTGIGFSLKEMIMDDFKLDSNINRMSVIGGGSKCEIWLQILANILNCPIQKGRGDSLLGAAMIAEPEIAPPLNLKNRIIKPDMKAVSIYETLFKIWQNN